MLVSVWEKVGNRPWSLVYRQKSVEWTLVIAAVNKGLNIHNSSYGDQHCSTFYNIPWNYHSTLCSYCMRSAIVSLSLPLHYMVLIYRSQSLLCSKRLTGDLSMIIEWTSTLRIVWITTNERQYASLSFANTLVLRWIFFRRAPMTRQHSLKCSMYVLLDR